MTTGAATYTTVHPSHGAQSTFNVGRAVVSVSGSKEHCVHSLDELFF